MAVVRAPAKQTFQLFPQEKAKADAESVGVFRPQPDHATIRNNTEGKATAGVDSDVDAAGTCTEPAIHVEWRDMSDDDKNSFVGAVKCLLGKPSAGTQYSGSQSRYEDLVSVHQQMTGSIHMVGQFLPWHRYYLSIYESILREECQYGGPMPWWDESKDATDFTVSPLFTDQWFGPIPVKGPSGEETCLGTGFPITLHIGPGSSLTDRCLSRALDSSLTSQCTADFANYCNSYTDYASMESCTEEGPHAYCHNGIGGAMSDVASSPGDPVFFMHHSFVDHSWRMWQRSNSAQRLYQISGYTTQSPPFKQTTLDTPLYGYGIIPDAKVRDVMDTLGGYLCYKYDY